MASDQEYLAQAGIDAETGEKATASLPSQPTQGDIKSPEAQAEMFEIAGQKYPVDTQFKLTHDGKVLNVPYKTMANTYRQWQHLQDKWTNEYKPKISEFEKLKPEFDKYKGFYDKYGQLQTWSEQNPKEWEALWNLYQNRDKHLLETKAAGSLQAPAQANQSFQPLVEEISRLKQELEGLNNFKSSFEQEQQSKKEQADTELIQGEIKQFKESYPEINLDERDPDGVTLWAKVMKFGMDNGLPTFKAAANLFFEQRLQDIWSSRSRSDAVKNVQADKQAGIIRRSATPFSGKEASPTNIKNMSYAEIAEMAKGGHFAEAAAQ